MRGGWELRSHPESGSSLWSGCGGCITLSSLGFGASQGPLWLTMAWPVLQPMRVERVKAPTVSSVLTPSPPGQPRPGSLNVTACWQSKWTRSFKKETGAQLTVWSQDLRFCWLGMKSPLLHRL